jgi:hypothetical protein
VAWATRVRSLTPGARLHFYLEQLRSSSRRVTIAAATLQVQRARSSLPALYWTSREKSYA